jgi:hypothetical protein
MLGNPGRKCRGVLLEHVYSCIVCIAFPVRIEDTAVWISRPYQILVR